MKTIEEEIAENRQNIGLESILNTLHAAAYRNGRDIGKQEGLAQGEEIGFQKGFQAGYKEAEEKYQYPLPDPDPEKPVFNPLVGKFWGPNQHPADFRASMKLCLIYSGDPAKLYYGPGKSPGHKSFSTEPDDTEEKDLLTMLKSWAGTWAIPVAQPLIWIGHYLAGDGKTRDLSKSNIPATIQRLEQLGIAFHPYLSVKLIQKEAIELFGDEWLMKRSDNKRNAGNAMFTATHSCLYYENREDSPIHKIRAFMRQAASTWLDLAKEGRWNGATVTLDCQTDEWRMPIQQEPVDLEKGYVTDANPLHHAVFISWLFETFEGDVQALNAFLAATTKKLDGTSYTMASVGRTFSSFDQVPFSFNRANSRTTWLDYLTEMFNAIVSRALYEDCYATILDVFKKGGVPLHYRANFQTTAVFGQPVYGRQAPYTGQIPYLFLSERMRVRQQNPGPEQPAQQVGDMLRANTWPHELIEVQANIDAAFTRKMLTNVKAGWGWEPLTQYRMLHASGVTRLGVRTPFDNKGDNPRIQPYLNQMFQQIESQGYFTSPVIPQYKDADKTMIILDEMKIFSGQQNPDTELKLWASRSRAEKGVIVADGGKNWDNRVPIVVKRTLERFLPKLVQPDGKPA